MFDSTGLDPLRAALEETPALTLSFYSFGLLMRRATDAGETEYPVSPDDVAAALAAKMTFNTGLLTADTLCVLAEGGQRTVVEYRAPQKTALWLEGSQEALRVPLPGLVLARTSATNSEPKHSLWAVKERPIDFTAPLFHAPLPNVYTHGGICWGTVTRGNMDSQTETSLAGDWSQLLGTPFGNHSVSGKSRRYRDDVRKMHVELEQRNARVYPKRDLLDARRTLGGLLGVEA